MSDKLTHTDADGSAHMVDVGGKTMTKRTAIAEARVSMKPATADLIRANALQKGDVLAVARVAGIMAAKKTHELIPLCHPLAITGVDVTFEWPSSDVLRILATAKVDGKTGVEMEALTAATTSALTVYDMAKAVDKAMTISDVCLLEKTGGKSGTYRRDGDQ